MKKFTDDNNVEKQYSGSNVLRNELFDLVENTLTPSIDGITKNLTISGKADLVEELVKIVENAGIDAAIDVFRNLKPGENKMINENVDPLTKAFEEVYTTETPTEHPQLQGLKAMWDLDDDKLNQILWVFTNEGFRSYEAIGYADDFLSYIDGSDFDISDLESAWDGYASQADQGVEFEVNPFIK